jgi:hypothetical protein
MWKDTAARRADLCPASTNNGPASAKVTTAGVYDDLSILGLENQPTAFLKVDIVCLECVNVLNSYNSLQL